MGHIGQILSKQAHCLLQVFLRLEAMARTDVIGTIIKEDTRVVGTMIRDKDTDVTTFFMLQAVVNSCIQYRLNGNVKVANYCWSSRSSTKMSASNSSSVFFISASVGSACCILGDVPWSSVV